MLYLWHLADTAGIMAKLLNVLSKDVAADCHGNLYVSTRHVQHRNKRKAAEDSEREDVKLFRRSIQTSFEHLAMTNSNLALTKKEQRLSEQRKEIQHAKLQMIEACTNHEKKKCWQEYLVTLEDDFNANKEEIEFLKCELAKKLLVEPDTGDDSE